MKVNMYPEWRKKPTPSRKTAYFFKKKNQIIPLHACNPSTHTFIVRILHRLSSGFIQVHISALPPPFLLCFQDHKPQTEATPSVFASSTSSCRMGWAVAGEFPRSHSLGTDDCCDFPRHSGNWSGHTYILGTPISTLPRS